MKNIQELLTFNVHKVVIELIKNKKKNKVLDAPYGGKTILIRLKKLEFEPFATNIDNDASISKNKVKFYQFDLNEIFLFKDKTFEDIICIERIEYLENHFEL